MYICSRLLVHRHHWSRGVRIGFRESVAEAIRGLCQFRLHENKRSYEVVNEVLPTRGAF